MRLNRKVQYGLLFVLYITRAGRVTIESAAEGLGLSTSFLEQVARNLRLAGVVKSIRGTHGGYELEGDPNMQAVFEALSPVNLLGREEFKGYSKGSSEHRALAHYVASLGLALAPLLKRKVRNVSNDLVAQEMARLNRAPASMRAN
jgi:Rrf2 family protein